MRFQNLPWSCGPAALVNAFRALGSKIAELKVRRAAGCSEEHGADEFGLMAAARELGFSAVPNTSHDVASAWAFVRANVMDGRPCLLCIDSWGHWVTAVGTVGDRLLIADPSNGKRNMYENGVHPFRRQALARRWRHSRVDDPFYAIAIGMR